MPVFPSETVAIARQRTKVLLDCHRLTMHNDLIKVKSRLLRHLAFRNDLPAPRMFASDKKAAFTATPKETKQGGMQMNTTDTASQPLEVLSFRLGNEEYGL